MSDYHPWLIDDLTLSLNGQGEPVALPTPPTPIEVVDIIMVPSYSTVYPFERLVVHLSDGSVRAVELPFQDVVELAHILADPLTGPIGREAALRRYVQRRLGLEIT